MRPESAMESSPLNCSGSEEDAAPPPWRCRLLVPLAALATLLLLRGASSGQLRVSLSKSSQLFVIPIRDGEGNGELPANNADVPQNPFLYQPTVTRSPDPPLPVRHRGYDCWRPCLGAGICSNFCGEGNACCRKGALKDPPECRDVTDFWTEHHECVEPVVQVKVNHFAQDCWPRCETGGDCAWCGEGQACCRKNSALDPPECHGITDWPTDRHHTCVTPVKEVAVKHEGQDCLDFCEGRGQCNWCGKGNACCHYGDEYDPPECRAVVYFPSKEHHVCVKPTFPKLAEPEKPEKKCSEGEIEGPKGCMPRKPVLVTFYVYRLGDGSPTNVNTGSLGAIMYLIHTKILGCPRRDGVDRIHRFRVTVKNTEAEFYRQENRTHKFGPLLSYRNGQCVSASCDDTFRRFGYSVGCGRSEGQISYPSVSRPAWYSLPGACPSKPSGEKTEMCMKEFPGGECDEPTGLRNCTFHVEDAGSVSLDELTGRNSSTSLKDWCAAGNVEYDPSTDRGVGTDFWDHLNDGSLGKERMTKLAYLFWSKYPDLPARLPEPCHHQ